MSKKRGRKEGSEPSQDEREYAKTMTEAKDEQPTRRPARRSMTPDEVRRLRHREVSRKSRQRQRDREAALRDSLEIVASENTDLEAQHSAIIRSHDLITDTHLSAMALHQVNSLIEDNHELRMRIIREEHTRSRNGNTGAHTHTHHRVPEGREQTGQGSPSLRNRGSRSPGPSEFSHGINIQPSTLEASRFVETPHMYHAAIYSSMPYPLNVPSSLPTPPMLGQMMDPHTQLHQSLMMHQQQFPQVTFPMPLLYPSPRLDAATLYPMAPYVAPYPGRTHLPPHYPPVPSHMLSQSSPRVGVHPYAAHESMFVHPSSRGLLPGSTTSFPPQYSHIHTQPPALRLSTDRSTTANPNPNPNPNPSTGAATHGASMPGRSHELDESSSNRQDEDEEDSQGSEDWGVI